MRFSGPADARARQIEMVFQDLSLCDHIDVVGNLFLGRELTKRPVPRPPDDVAEAREMLDALEIRIPSLTAKVEKLSGGQRQAIAIARAASFDPKVLIMDEPTSALAVAEVEAVLSAHQPRQGQAASRVVLITHRLQDLFRVCDRIAVMYEGTKVAEREIRQDRPRRPRQTHRRRGERSMTAYTERAEGSPLADFLGEHAQVLSIAVFFAGLHGLLLDRRPTRS